MPGTGIIGYGAWVPRYRITVEEIARVWGADAAGIERGLGLKEKSVPGRDQDVITMSVAAGRSALRRASIDPTRIGAVYVGSESHPYAVKPSSATVAEALGCTPSAHGADLEFACKAGTEAMFLCQSLVESGREAHALAVAADTAQGAPGNALEYSAGAGAAAFLFGSEGVLAEVEETCSFMTDTPDFWRREHRRYPRHAGRFTGEPAYFRHTLGAARDILARSGRSPADFRHVVLHQPNGKYPQRAARELGFAPEQWRAGLLAPAIGNTYSAASPLGLAAALDDTAPGERVLLVSYGSGSGADAFVLRATPLLAERRGAAPRVRDLIERRRTYLDYGVYAKLRDKITLDG